jgi:hypothetical protein
MDYIDYEPSSIANPSRFPSVSASSASPKTLYQAHTYITYVNIGSGWTPLCQTVSNSFYAVLDPVTKANVMSALLSSTSVAPKLAIAALNVLGRH